MKKKPKATVKKQVKNSEPVVPTPVQMKKFATQFSKEEWELLCDSKGFMDTITTDLVTCQLVANNILERFRNPTSV